MQLRAGKALSDPSEGETEHRDRDGLVLWSVGTKGARTENCALYSFMARALNKRYLGDLVMFVKMGR